MNGNLFIVCAASGTGKSSLVAELIKNDQQVRLSISYTTRPPRPSEVDGREYHFVSKEKFQQMLGQGEFLESAEVHGNFYGTSQCWIEAQRQAGCDILLEIDWQGAAQVRKLIADAIGIFILPPSLEALRERLEIRAQDKPEVIERRIAAAREEISHMTEFKYVIINENFAEAARDLTSMVRAERLTASVQLQRHTDLINGMK